MSAETANDIIDGLFSVRGTVQNIIVITIDNSGAMIFRSSFDHPSDDIYCFEATKYQILYNDFQRNVRSSKNE